MITKEIALTLRVGTTLYHKTLRNADGSALRARVSGKCRTWKREPARWELPMKHGLRDCFYITQYGAQQSHEWSLTDPTEESRERERIEKRKASIRKRLKLADDTPDCVMRDAMIDNNMGEKLAEICFQPE